MYAATDCITNLPQTTRNVSVQSGETSPGCHVLVSSVFKDSLVNIGDSVDTQIHKMIH
jgi:hypothetical protein